MTKATAELLDKVRKLPATERQEICEAILREGVFGAAQAVQPMKRIADVAGKYSPQAEDGAADHDQGFVDAIVASKAGNRGA